MKGVVQCLLILMLVASARAVQAQFTYTTNADGVSLTITGYTGPSGDVTIPTQVGAMTVINIGDDAFFNVTNLTSIEIPGSVAGIGNRTFANCTGLTNLSIKDGVASVGDDAFSHCVSLAAVTIPGSVTNLGQAFIDCTNLASVTIHDGVTILGSGAFQFCTRLTSVTIPASVASVGNYAFGSCRFLTNVVMVSGVIGIGGEAFNYCSALTTVVIPDSVTSIGSSAFDQCSALTNVTIPASVSNIGFAPFEGCASLKAITVDQNNSFYSSINGVLFDKTQTTLLQYPGGLAGTYVIPNGVTGIGTFAFSACANLSGVVIPGSVTNILDEAFNECQGLRTVTIPASVTHIENWAFAECTNLASVFFQGNAPRTDGIQFGGTIFPPSATIYYLPGASGWLPSVPGFMYAGGLGLAGVLWNPLIQTTNGSFGIRDDQFGFNVTGTSNIPVVVEASTDLSGSDWTRLASFSLTNGLFYFSDPDWTNFPARYYRIGSR